MRVLRAPFVFTALLLGLFGQLPLSAQFSLAADKDNTLYDRPNGSVSNGAGSSFFVGRSGGFQTNFVRRGVISFDVAAGLPAGTTITDVRLVLNMSMTISGPQPIELHRLLADWGEGASSAGGGGGGGAPSAPGDATWLHTFFPGSLWATPGGDFDSQVSGMTMVDQIGYHTWTSTPQMVADVQSWLDNPAANFGWILTGVENVNLTAKRFDSRENSNPSLRPLLLINCTLPPAITYCTAKPGLACGLPVISTEGIARASATSGFLISASPARNAKFGVLLYTNAGAAVQPFPLGAHILCLATPPLRRGGPVTSGGIPGPFCDGVFTLDMNAFASGSYSPGFPTHNPAPFLSIPGQQVNCQWWGRDTVATGTFVSDAVEYFVCP